MHKPQEPRLWKATLRYEINVTNEESHRYDVTYEFPMTTSTMFQPRFPSLSIPMHIIITGAAKGIGRGLTRLFLQKGHRVGAIDHDHAELMHLGDKLHKANLDSSAFCSWHADLRSHDEIEFTAQLASEFFDGHLDLLINNAAYTAGAVGAVKMSDENFVDNWTAAIETNLTAPSLLSRACLPMLRKDATRGRKTGGSIINMSSTRAHQSEPHHEGYSATKAGLIGLTHNMAISLAEEGMGIRVNTILPGWINVANECKEADEKAEREGSTDWPGTRWEDSGPMSKEDHEWHPAGRVGKVEDILRAVEFVTGQEIVVDGGVGRKMMYRSEATNMDMSMLDSRGIRHKPW